LRLNILIGMGSAQLECFLEWVEERVEQLLPIEDEAGNRMLCATLHPSATKAEYEDW
jgi:hypothetical protein